ncbi:MAG: microcystin-dependent protein, partial [Bacteroidota bacterium]
HPLGQKGGTETVTLTVNQLPSHTHSIQLYADSTVATSDKPNDALPARNAGSTPQYGTVANTELNASSAAIGNIGGNLPVNNMQPFMAVNYIIALQGIFPSRP